jgi:hypothetical protein
MFSRSGGRIVRRKTFRVAGLAKVKKKWLRQESNLDLELRKLLYYPLYYEAKKANL